MIEIVESVASATDFVRLRAITGLSPRPEQKLAQALARSLYGVQLRDGEKVVGMGRVVGDGGLNFDIVDIAVDPQYQGQGLGRKIMESIMAYVDADAPKGAYVCLMADVPELYEKFGFVLTRPGSEGMYLQR